MAKFQVSLRASAITLIAGAVSETACAVAVRVGLAERVRELGRRVRRAGLLFVLLVSALIVMSLTGASIPFLLWFISIPVAAFAAILSLMWPARRRPRVGSASRPGLSGLARRAARELARSRRAMPPESRKLADFITERLGAIETRAAHCRLELTAEIAARRLLSDDLPRLMSSYSRLRPEQRQAEGAIRAQLDEALVAISRELESLCRKIDQAHSNMFDTQRRFIASKYPEPVLDMP